MRGLLTMMMMMIYVMMMMMTMFFERMLSDVNERIYCCCSAVDNGGNRDTDNEACAPFQAWHSTDRKYRQLAGEMGPSRPSLLMVIHCVAWS